MTEQARRALSTLGLFLGLLGSYLLTSPGRIDFIDGQHRYEVARSWLDVGEPLIQDPALRRLGVVGNPGTGKAYSYYNAAPSITPMPLMAASRWLPGHTPDRDRLAFSLTAPLFGALVAALLMVAYGMLGVGLSTAIGCALVFALATSWWPGSVTTFDQNQHAFFLLASLLLAWHAGRRQSTPIAALAGVTGGLLILYQETYALLLPAIALAVFAPRGEGTTSGASLRTLGVDRHAVVRYVAFGTACCFGLGLLLAYNCWRFDSLVLPNRYQIPWPGNGLAGALSLAFSPGRSVFLFSPPLLLLTVGARPLWARAPVLAVAAGLMSVVHFVLVSNLAFFAGEWAWGPRYLLVLLPLAALGLPSAIARLHARRFIVAVVVGLGVAVQLMAVSLDHQRFYFERNLPPEFWAHEAWFYFKDSQLLARPSELAETLRTGVPREAVLFSPAPYREVTYAPFGPARPELGAAWVRRFQVFYLPRPWPFWMSSLDPPRRPVDPAPLVAACSALVVLGVGLVCFARLRPAAPVDDPSWERRRST